MTIDRQLKRHRAASSDALDAEIARVNAGIREHGSAAAYIDARESREEVQRGHEPQGERAWSRID